jgi:hypothetical protein
MLCKDKNLPENFLAEIEFRKIDSCCDRFMFFTADRARVGAAEIPA